MTRVAVVGGGLSGLVAALDLADAGADVELFEAGERAGGQVRTRQEAGFVVEEGAEGWVAGDTAVPALCDRLGLAGEIVQQLQRRSFTLSQGRLTDLAAGEAAKVLGIQASDADLGRGIASLRRGMGQLVDGLLTALGSRAKIRTQTPVTSVDTNGGRVALTDSGNSVHRFEAAILASGAPGIAAVTASFATGTADALSRIEHVSNVSVSLGYDRAVVAHPLDASGLVVASSEDLQSLRAVAFVSSKLPGRAAPGRVLLRAFFRPESGEIEQDDAAWIDRAGRLLAPVLGISARPLGAWVARWREALPQYATGHSELMRSAADELLRRGNIRLAGSSIHPGGVPGAVRSGREAAAAVLARQGNRG